MRHLFHPHLPNWAHNILRVSLSFIVLALVLMVLAVYFESFLLVVFGGLLLFASVVSFLSLTQAPSIRNNTTHDKSEDQP